MIREAIRHFRALKNYEGGTKVLHNDGNYGDPLSLYLRALCREGRESYSSWLNHHDLFDSSIAQNRAYLVFKLLQIVDLYVSIKDI